ncbi:caffeic acid 3-O-methyltransferase [Cynara cardunculus var. scolymus]|uniref:Caffeate O-methyltransferase (COMT) family n=1 Tax=Cynara cardunculus var. scolymus TaxID=59895 RepID=A0A103YFH8_CYNCS|nr:caffeic acid 3-O-methyltransferase [Cynara cardunculus var. scolymus]KVI08129.1 Caffeate O-methyltransferase (COMT) family [Cynara cardunculus var. scolymus]
MENEDGETPPRTADTNNGARLSIMELANMISVPMSLNAVVRLNVADAIWQNGSNTPLSASEILFRIFSSGVGDPENLQRILRMLTSYGVFNEHVSSGEELKRRYSLTDIGKTLVTDEKGLSYGPYVLQHHQAELMKAWAVVHEAVVDSSTEPFVKANGGETAYGIYGKKPEMNDLMLKAMSGVSVPFMKAVLEGYDGFEGVERLVDVGGSAGDCLRMILQKHTHIMEGVNFDLPEVVAKAPKIDGVTHVGGDMFNSIPHGDAIFMKWVLTTWTDDEVKAIMINCFKSIPVGGKLIACEPVLPDHTDDSHRTRALLEGDIFVMTIYRAKGKHRTEDEYRQLGKSVGFLSFQAIYIDHFYTLLEFKK